MEEPRQVLRMASQRLEALGDGIFAVAMTFLVIELKIPEIHGNSWSSFVSSWHESRAELLCYAISFILLGIMWFGHRVMFEFISRTNRYFIILGVLFYMVVCLVPFSTRFLAAYTFRWYGILVYGLNLSLCNLTLYSQWLYGIKRNSHLDKDVPPAVKREANMLFLISPLLYFIAIVFSFFWPYVSIGIFILTPLIYLFPNKLDKYLP